MKNVWNVHKKIPYHPFETTKNITNDSIDSYGLALEKLQVRGESSLEKDEMIEVERRDHDTCRTSTMRISEVQQQNNELGKVKHETRRIEKEHIGKGRKSDPILLHWNSGQEKQYGWIKSIS